MLRSLLASLLIAGFLSVSGCTMAQTQAQPLPSVDNPPAVEPIAHVYANVYGYDLLGWPLASGSAEHVNTQAFAWFEDTSTTQTVTEMILTEAREQGATHVIDLQTNFLSSWVSGLLIIWSPEAEGSATAIKVHTGDAPEGAIPVGDAPADQ